MGACPSRSGRVVQKDIKMFLASHIAKTLALEVVKDLEEMDVIEAVGRELPGLEVTLRGGLIKLTLGLLKTAAYVGFDEYMVNEDGTLKPEVPVHLQRDTEPFS